MVGVIRRFGFCRARDGDGDRDEDVDLCRISEGNNVCGKRNRCGYD